jgi:polar amino acid transport system substrate-binding protein
MLFALAFSWLASMGAPLAAQGANPGYSIITGDLPPYSYAEGKTRKGFAYDLALSIARRVGYPDEIKVDVWARVVQENANTKRIIFPLTRVPYREGKYQWIGPIIADRWVVLTRAEDPRTFSGLEDFRQLKIGALRGTPSETLINTLKFPFAEISPYNSYAFQKLIRGRLDAFMDLELEAYAQIKLEGEKVEKVKVAFVYQNVRIYFGASPDVDKAVVAEWQRALDQMKAKGEYAAILRRYGLAPR